jgi:hypothetical protein
MDVLRPIWYQTLWMSKWYAVTLHHIITVYNAMLYHLDGNMWAVAKEKKQWMEDIYLAVKFAQQKLSKYHAEVYSNNWYASNISRYPWSSLEGAIISEVGLGNGY